MVASACPFFIVTLSQVIFTLPLPPDQLNLSGLYTPSFSFVLLFTAFVEPLVSDSYLDSVSGFVSTVVVVFPVVFPLPFVLLFQPFVLPLFGLPLFPLFPLSPLDTSPSFFRSLELNVIVLSYHLLWLSEWEATVIGLSSADTGIS